MYTTYDKLNTWDKFFRVDYPYAGDLDTSTIWQKVPPGTDRYGAYNAISLSSAEVNGLFNDTTRVKKLPKDYK